MYVPFVYVFNVAFTYQLPRWLDRMMMCHGKGLQDNWRPGSALGLWPSLLQRDGEMVSFNIFKVKIGKHLNRRGARGLGEFGKIGSALMSLNGWRTWWWTPASLSYFFWTYEEYIPRNKTRYNLTTHSHTNKKHKILPIFNIGCYSKQMLSSPTPFSQIILSSWTHSFKAYRSYYMK